LAVLYPGWAYTHADSLAVPITQSDAYRHSKPNSYTN
jgi:hypothetical protein